MVSPIGANCSDTWHNLLNGKSGIGEGDFLSAPIIYPELEEPVNGLARVDRLLKLAVTEAIDSAQLSSKNLSKNFSKDLTKWAVVIGSSRGYQREWEQILRGNQPVENWHRFLIANLAGNVAIPSLGVCEVVSAACASGNWAIAKGCELIRAGSADLVIVGAVDSAITPLTVAGFDKLGVLAKRGVFPFSQEREGLAIGEGSAVVILVRPDFDSDEGYGYILGWGITNDAFHITSANPDLTSAQRAIDQCLTASQLDPQSIDYINAHGTATINNDRREALLISRVFPHRPMVSSTKGATGHCLGATGLMELIFCLLAIKHQRVPPCMGLQTPAFDLNLPRASISHPIRACLNFSFGFGGQNTVVAMAGNAVIDH
jgi:3-oxoacyl-[acyl-carrier-protein] synthase II